MWGQNSSLYLAWMGKRSRLRSLTDVVRRPHAVATAAVEATVIVVVAAATEVEVIRGAVVADVTVAIVKEDEEVVATAETARVDTGKESPTFLRVFLDILNFVFRVFPAAAIVEEVVVVVTEETETATQATAAGITVDPAKVNVALPRKSAQCFLNELSFCRSRRIRELQLLEAPSQSHFLSTFLQQDSSH